MALYIGGTKVKLNVLYGDYAISGGKLLWANPNLYLKSSGTQYIDTGVIGNGSKTTFEIKFQTSAEGYNGFFGSRYGAVARGFMFHQLKDGTCRFDYGNQYVYNLPNSGILKSTINGGKYTLENGSFSSSVNVQSFDTFKTIDLFRIWSSSYDVTVGILKISFFKLYENDTLVRHFVPVPVGLQIGSFTVPSNGMFDIVEQKFYENKGTGEFEYGRDE